jgi:hypothetical protein
MHASTYLFHAKDLIERVKRRDFGPGCNGQAECRSSISRAYYAVHHLACDFFETIGLRAPTSGEAHVAIIQGLLESGDDELSAIGSDLETLHSQRHAADYKLRDPRTESLSHAETMVTMAESAAGQINSQKAIYTKDPPIGKATADRIKAWSDRSSRNFSWIK